MNDDYINLLIEKGKRLDERNLEEYRKIELESNISKNAEGSAKCKLGATEVIAGVKLDLGEPYPDNPDEGTIIVTVELSPLASPEFELGPPGTQATELARIVDRGIRESKAIDFKQLCLKKGEKVWLLFIDIYPINDDGNLIDASVLAVIKALQQVRFPKLENDKVVYGEFTNEKLKLNKLPITITLCKINNKFIVDPSHKEEQVLSSRLSIAISNDNIHAIQKGGNHGLSIEDINKMVDVAMKKEKELRKLIS